MGALLGSSGGVLSRVERSAIAMSNRRVSRQFSTRCAAYGGARRRVCREALSRMRKSVRVSREPRMWCLNQGEAGV